MLHKLQLKVKLSFVVDIVGPCSNDQAQSNMAVDIKRAHSLSSRYPTIYSSLRRLEMLRVHSVPQCVNLGPVASRAAGVSRDIAAVIRTDSPGAS